MVVAAVEAAAGFLYVVTRRYTDNGTVAAAAGTGGTKSGTGADGADGAAGTIIVEEIP